MIKWIKIKQLAGVLTQIKKIKKYHTEEGMAGYTPPLLTYKGKPKLHGTNVSIEVNKGQRSIRTFSRTREITPDSDNYGFSRWVHESGCGSRLLENVTQSCIIYGEWVGKGIQKGVSLANMSEKQLCVFSVLLGIEDSEEEDDNRIIVTCPEEILSIIGKSKDDIYVIPFINTVLKIDMNDMNTIRSAIKIINKDVASIVEEDTWSNTTFNVSGGGEGIVYYPYRVEKQQAYKLEFIEKWIFKAKGGKFRVVNQAKAAVASLEQLEFVEDIIKTYMTEARLKQGVSDISQGDISIKDMGKFIAWILKDIKKEYIAENANADLKLINKASGAIANKARAWLMQEIERNAFT